MKEIIMLELILSTGAVIIIVIVVYQFLMRGIVEAPPVMSIEELEAEGLTKQEARVELRRQRQETRQHTVARNNSVRTGLQAVQIVKRFLK